MPRVCVDSQLSFFEKGFFEDAGTPVAILSPFWFPLVLFQQRRIYARLHVLILRFGNQSQP